MTRSRIETSTSCTAKLTCVARAVSSLEPDPPYHSDDHLSVRLLPGPFKLLAHVPLFRTLYRRALTPPGIYEYVIARTWLIDAALAQALADEFDQILIFGAGFDTRALRFWREGQVTRVFELDAPVTQQAKLGQYGKRGLTVPPNVAFIAIDFDRESLPDKLDAAGFRKGARSLFILEGVLMYLEPASVRATFGTIGAVAGAGSRVVFDYVRASVLRHENTVYGEEAITRNVSSVREGWRFGLEPAEVGSFLADFGFEVADHQCAEELEATYFQEAGGGRVGRINGAHCIVTAVKR